MTRVRVRTLTTPEDDGRPGAYRFVYGLRYLGALAGISERTMKRRRESGQISLGQLADPVQAVAFCLAERGHPHLADYVLERLEREPRYGGPTTAEERAAGVEAMLGAARVETKSGPP